MIKREPNQTSPAFMPLERGPKGKKKKKSKQKLHVEQIITHDSKL